MSEESERREIPRINVSLREGVVRPGRGPVLGGGGAANEDRGPVLGEASDDKTAFLLDDRVLNPVTSLDLEDLGLQVEIPREQISRILEQRLKAVTEVFTTIDFVRKDLKDLIPAVPESFPPQLSGRLVNPDGSDAAYVSVRALEPTGVATTSSGTSSLTLAWPNPETRTDARGSFSLSLPPRPIPDDGLTLRVAGSNRAIDVGLRRIDLISGGRLGTVPLDHEVAPLPRSALAELGEVLVPTDEEDALEHPEAFAAPTPTFTLGEGECARFFRSNSGVVDRFRYSMLVRLVAPHLSTRRLTSRFTRGDKTVSLSAASADLSRYTDTGALIEILGSDGTWELSERSPIEAPLDITKFLTLVQRNPRAVPKAATLGMGYVVKMNQVWIPTGLSLGDLVYSLPLAPGEQQRLAVSDERETLSVREQEAMTADEVQRFNEAADTSTSAVFRSSFDEAASGGSRMKTRTEAGAIGGGLGVGGFFSGIVAGLGIAGGYSDSTTTGSTSSWQNASRDYVSSSAQDFHSSLARQSAVRRSAARTSVRLASSSERREVVTKVITNHNHNHALTMQYWQVLRHFGVTSTVDDVQLVCFVPFELIQFLPPDVPTSLPTGSYSRNQLLYRYSALLAHHDVISSRVWWRSELRHGLSLLRSFAGNPTMGVESSSGAAQDILNVSITGTFLPFEDVYVSAVTTNGARVGPVKLNAASPAIAAGQETRAGLLQLLRTRRNDTSETRTGALALPNHQSRSNLARLEFSRAYRTFSYRLSLPSSLDFTDLIGYLTNTTKLDVTMTGDELEREIGGPVVNDPTATITGVGDVLESYNGPGGTDRMPVVMPVAAKRLPPVLPFADLLRIEALLQHVVENTVEYSKAVWQSLTPEERAILLEPYTIGVPTGGISDPSDEVPLLNCVANEVLGWFGNSAVMPFFIPAPLAKEIGFTSRDIQEALLKFHRQSYLPAQSSITLPARGVLGEAVLGSCNSSEKIDLTRFWNWQDSPGDEATALESVAGLLGGGNQLVGSAGAQAPATLESSPMITINQGPAAFTPTDLAKALVESQPESNLPKDLTGITQLGAQMKVQTETTAESLNKTISEASGLAKAAMTALPEAIKAKKGTTGTGGTGGTGGGTGGTGGGTGGTGGGTGGTGGGTGGTGGGTGGTGGGGTGGTGGTGGGGTGGTGGGTGGTGGGTGGTGGGTGGTGGGTGGTGGTGGGTGGTGAPIDGGGAPSP